MNADGTNNGSSPKEIVAPLLEAQPSLLNEVGFDQEELMKTVVRLQENTPLDERRVQKFCNDVNTNVKKELAEENVHSGRKDATAAFQPGLQTNAIATTTWPLSDDENMVRLPSGVSKAPLDDAQFVDEQCA